MTDLQREMLHSLKLRPHGMVVRDEAGKSVLMSMLHTGWVSDLYEMPQGGMTARITHAGRLALEDQ